MKNPTAKCLLALLTCGLAAPVPAQQVAAPAVTDPAPGGDAHAFSDRMAADKAASEDARRAAKGDDAAVARLLQGANAGEPAAQFYLALLYKDGLGVPKDDARYALWLEMAAEQDYPGAQARLIGVYETGKGVPKDAVKSAQWARRCAERGEMAGQLALVLDYYYGRGVPKNLVEAIKWQAVLEAAGYVSKDDEFTQQIEHDAGPFASVEGRSLAREWLMAFRSRKKTE
jgi:TPR repeat protein